MWLLHCDTNKLILLLQDECCWYIVDQIAMNMYKTSLDNLLQLLLLCLWMLCCIHQHHHHHHKKTLRKIFINCQYFSTYISHFLVQILRQMSLVYFLLTEPISWYKIYLRNPFLGTKSTEVYSYIYFKMSFSVKFDK